MDKKIIKEFENLFLKLKQSKSKKYWPEVCDIAYLKSKNELKKIMKIKEKEIYLNIDKEISSRKEDRATLMKAKRLSKNKDVESKYIDLRYEEFWEEIDENELKPLMAIFLNKILKEQSDYEKKNKSKPIGGDAMFDS